MNPDPLGPQARDLLDQARPHHEPSPQDRARLRRKLAAAGVLAPSPPPPDPTPPGPAPPSPAGHAAASLLKSAAARWLLSALAVGALAVGAVRSQGSAKGTPPAGSPLAVSAASSAAPPALAQEEPSAPRPEEPAPSRATASAQPAERAASAQPAAKGAPGSDDLRGDIELLAEARRAIAQGSAPRGLSLLQKHRQTYPRSPLSQERSVLVIQALCQSGQQAAGKAEAQRFLASFPNSPFTTQVRQVCKLP